MELCFKNKETIDVLTIDSIIEYLSSIKGEEYIFKKNVPVYKDSKMEYKHCITKVKDISSIKKEFEINEKYTIERNENVPITLADDEIMFNDYFYFVRLIEGIDDLIIAKDLQLPNFNYSSISPMTFSIELKNDVKIDFTESLKEYNKTLRYLENLLECRIEAIIDHTNLKFDRYVKGEKDITFEIDTLGKLFTNVEYVLDYDDFLFVKKKMFENKFIIFVLNKQNER